MSLASVLVVDDNAPHVENLAEILGTAGYDVHTAGRCDDARREARRGFDVALVDVRLPDGEGTRLAPELKSMFPGSEIILLTGFATLESAIDAVRAGAWAYLVKPCSPPDLLMAVDQALRHVKLAAEKRRLVDRTRVAEKLAALGAMAASLAHEIRNPMNAAQLHLQIAERRLGTEPADTKAARDAVGIVRAELDRLNNTVEDVLAYARPAGLLLVEQDLAATVASVVQFLAPDLAAHGVALGAPGLPLRLMAVYDEDRIRQALINVIRNAADAAGSGGEVSVSLSLRDDLATLVVEDSGPGIPPGTDPFTPFVTSKKNGTGLGLAIVQRTVNEHAGTVGFSRRDGRTRCTILLPLRGPNPTIP